MRAAAKGFIARKEADYIKLLLSHAEPRGKEIGLERLCAHYRVGFFLREVHDVCQTLNGLLYDGDPNVRRWAFNAIALVGNRKHNLDATTDAINRNRDNDDILAAGIAALASLTDREAVETAIKHAGMEVEGPILLAAAQYSRDFHDRLDGILIDPEKAGPTELRLATVLVGTGKAPEHLFSRKHPNSTVLGSLHSHGEKLVAQYAAWAAWENPQLGIRHLGFPPTKMRDQMPDVRKYAVRLLGQSDGSAEEFSQLIDEFSYDGEAKVREGLASGIVKSYFIGMEAMTARWYTREDDPSARSALVDHFIVNADRCGLYRSEALGEYKRAPQGSVTRAKMEARAEGLEIYREFRKIDLRATSMELFGEEIDFRGGNVTNNTYTVNAQNVAVVGESNSVSGGIEQTAHQVNEQAAELLDALIGLIEADAGKETLVEGKELAQAAKAEPSKPMLERVISWMEGVQTASTVAIGASNNFMTILHGLQAILPQLGGG